MNLQPIPITKKAWNAAAHRVHQLGRGGVSVRSRKYRLAYRYMLLIMLARSRQAQGCPPMDLAAMIREVTKYGQG